MLVVLCACGDRHRPDDGASGTASVGTTGDTGGGPSTPPQQTTAEDEGAKFDLAVGETEGTDCPPDNEHNCADDDDSGGAETGGPGIECSCPATWDVAGEQAFGDPFDLAPSGAWRGAMRAAGGGDEIGVVHADGTAMRFLRLDRAGTLVAEVDLPFTLAASDTWGVGGLVVTSIAWTGSEYAVGWRGEDGAELATLDAHGNVLAGPVAVAVGGGGYHPVLATKDDAVAVGFIDASGAPVLRRFSSTLMPIGDPVAVDDGAQASMYTLAIAPHGDRIGLVYLTDGPQLAWIDDDDSVDTIDFGHTEATSNGKTTLTVIGDTAAVCWQYRTHPSPYDVRCRFVDSDGDLLGEVEVVNPLDHLVALGFDAMKGPCGEVLVLLHGSLPYTGVHKWWLAVGDPASATWTRVELSLPDVPSANVSLVAAQSGVRALLTERLQPSTDNHNRWFELGC
jgi:hypothetical protein